jgi:solute carrier family 25 protein 38
MVREGGLRSMFDGLALRMGRKAMSSALAWTVYEELIRRAEIRWVADEARREIA